MSQGTNLGSQKGRWIILAALVAVLGALLFLLPGVQAQDGTTIEYTENSTDAVVTLTANDPEEVDTIVWSLLTDTEAAFQTAIGPNFQDIDGDGDDDVLEADTLRRTALQHKQRWSVELQVSTQLRDAPRRRPPGRR